MKDDNKATCTYLLGNRELPKLPSTSIHSNLASHAYEFEEKVIYS